MKIHIQQPTRLYASFRLIFILGLYSAFFVLLGAKDRPNLS